MQITDHMTVVIMSHFHILEDPDLIIARDLTSCVHICSNTGL